jgi:hypothetical protein
MLQCFVYSTSIMEALKVRGHVDSWNDDRLDELSGRVDAGFAKVDEELKTGFAKVDEEMKAGFVKVDKEMKSGFAELRAANERMYRLLLGSAVSIVVALIAALAAALAT